MRNRRKSIVGLIIVLIMGLVVLTGCGGSTSAPSSKEQVNPIKLSLVHPWPATHAGEVAMQEWSKAVEEATDGLIKIDTYPSNTLIPPPEAYQGVVDGIADIGVGLYTYTRGRFPVVEAFLLPGISYNSSVAGTYAINEGLSILNPQELQDTKHFFTFSLGEGYLFTNQPVREVKNIQGMELGVTSGPRVDAINALGAIGVFMPIPQVYENLQAGIIKGAVLPLETLQGYRLSEVTGDYITRTPFLFSQKVFAVMNKEKWNSLSPDLQVKFEEATQKYFEEKIPGLYDEINQKGWEYHKKQKPSVEIATLSPEEEAKWLAAIEPIIQSYVKELNNKGLPGEQIIQTVRDLAKKYNDQYPKK